MKGVKERKKEGEIWRCEINNFPLVGSRLV
jgi:hypothetical protein